MCCISDFDRALSSLLDFWPRDESKEKLATDDEEFVANVANGNRVGAQMNHRKFQDSQVIEGRYPRNDPEIENVHRPNDLRWQIRQPRPQQSQTMIPFV
jgi:hypothetical protein